MEHPNNIIPVFNLQDVDPLFPNSYSVFWSSYLPNFFIKIGISVKFFKK